MNAQMRQARFGAQAPSGHSKVQSIRYACVRGPSTSFLAFFSEPTSGGSTLRNQD